ncbi:MAG: hypothetical protein M3O30_16375 [Planctomycetota bacterium]|nr:hypothetical protein [Planctomycetota bacterium]
MPNHPAGFKDWLSGTCNCSEPPCWSCKISPTSVAIVPGWKFILIASIMFFAFSIIPGGLFWGVHTDRTIFGIVGMTISGAVGVLGGGASIFLLATAFIERRKGPYLIYSTFDRKLMLPRESLVFPHTDALEWRLITGNWIGAEGQQKKQDFPISELHLIVKTPTGPLAYVVVGSTAYSMTEQSRQIAKATGMPIEILEQHQGVTEEPKSKQMQSWRASGM